jgi:hypothetical protein
MVGLRSIWPTTERRSAHTAADSQVAGPSDGQALRSSISPLYLVYMGGCLSPSARSPNQRSFPTQSWEIYRRGSGNCAPVFSLRPVLSTRDHQVVREVLPHGNFSEKKSSLHDFIAASGRRKRLRGPWRLSIALALNMLVRRFATLFRFAAALLKRLYFNRTVAIHRAEAAI